MKQRVICPECHREMAVTYGGRVYRHNTSRDGQTVCLGSRELIGPGHVAPVTCPTCKGVGTIRPEMVLG